MCQHALCEHRDGSAALSPQAPTFFSRAWALASLGVPLLLLLALPLFARHIIPLTLQLALLLVFVASLAFRAATFPHAQLSDAQRRELHSQAEHQEWLARSAKQKEMHAQNLSAALQIPTISYDAHDEKQRTDFSTFLRLHALLAKQYPLVHAQLERTVINEYSLVFRWKGSNSASAKPILLTAHTDVVPVPDAHLWSEAPFSGAITADGYICGRGAIDDKQAVCGILGAVEDLLQGGYKPTRDVYIALGHDEEVSGKEGAANIAKWMKERKLQFEFMLDEGLFVMSGMLPGLTQPVAMVCVSEKGFVVSEYSVSVPPELAGHASAPASSSAIGILSRAMLRMESNPMPAYLMRGSPVRLMFEHLAPHFSPVFRLLFANLWLFGPMLKLLLTFKNTTATMVRTTTALTVFHSGSKSNVVPREARALLNHRVHPADSVEGVLRYSRAVVNDARVRISEVNSIPPAPVSSATSAGFRVLQRALGRALPDVLVAPALMVGNTDTYHYWGLADDIYRFSPTRVDNKTVAMFHGANERIAVDNFVETIGFYRAVIQLANE